MIKLRLGFDKMVERVHDNFFSSVNNFYDDMTKQTQHSQINSTAHIYHSHQPKQQAQSSKQSYFRISSIKKQPTTINNQNQQSQNQQHQRVLNKNIRHQKIKNHQTTIKLQQEQHLLLARKKKLLTELNEINSQLKSCNKQHSRIVQKETLYKQQQSNTQLMSQKAQQLVKKMNNQRQQLSLRKRKSIQSLNNSILKSIEVFHESLAEQERMKQIRRQQIHERISRRKICAIQRGVAVNMSETVLRHFVQRVAKDNSRVCQGSNARRGNIKQIDDRRRQMRMKGQSGQNSEEVNSQMNPEQLLSSIPHLPHIRTEQSKISLRSSSKSYSRSPFLQKVLKQEDRNKKLSYLKTLQRKRVHLKHKQYAEKTRGKVKNYVSNSMFLT